MALWTGSNNVEEILDAAKVWKQSCLAKDGSLFSDRNVWTLKNLESLDAAITQSPIEGKASFYEKIEEQLSGVNDDAKILAAECLWVILLFVTKNDFSPSTKRERISDILLSANIELDESSSFVSDSTLHGIGSPGTAYLTMIPNEFSFLVEFVKSFKGLAAARRLSLLNEDNPWEFCEWLTGVQGGDRRIFRQAILFLLRPKYFERICSKHHKKKIVERLIVKYGDDFKLSYDVDTICDTDRALYDFRKHLSTVYDTEKLDFYLEPLRSLWDNGSREPGEVKYWIEKTIVKGRADRQIGEHALGKALWSPQRSASGQDIYKTMREVVSGDIVFHLTNNQHIAGVSIAASSVDTDFVGLEGTDWANSEAYRIELEGYEKLTPPLEREVFLDTSPFKDKLSALVNSGVKGLFFTKKLALNQGKYLTPAPEALVQTLASAYWAQSQKSLPYVNLPESLQNESTEIKNLENELNFNRVAIMEDLFLSDGEIDDILQLWTIKKNVIIQGPPGVGKSFAAKRLAYLLNESSSDEKIGLVQFHQSYSYEDFVEGFRPTGEGFELKQGKFVKFCKNAAANPDQSFVFIIDEINRGNLSKIMGELMLLIEPDKRDESWAIELSYGAERFYVPSNVFLLGLMNTADRSLAVVDYALRRRFAFIDLAPKISSIKFEKLLLSHNVNLATIQILRDRLMQLNKVIREDTQNLGSGFEIGHSFFCGKVGPKEDGTTWYNRIIRTEVVPLLREYWFDAPEKVDEWQDRLLIASV